jgi:rubrerythrin
MTQARKPAPKEHPAVNAITRALRFEKSGMRYYEMAASKAADPYARKTFALLADMERKHMSDIGGIARRLEGEGKFPKVSAPDSEGRMRLFRREIARIRKEKTISGDSAAAMRKALGFEAEGREMYDRMSKAAADPQERRFFRLLSLEEQAHFEIVYEYLDYLEAVGLKMRE